MVFVGRKAGGARDEGETRVILIGASRGVTYERSDGMA